MENNINPEEQPNDLPQQPTLFSDKQIEKITGTTETIIKEIVSGIKEWVANKHKQDFTGLIIFGFIVIAILTTICFLSYYGKISEATIGAILGSLIGYALGRFNTNNQKDK